MESNLSIFDTVLRIFIGMIIGAVCGVMGWLIGIVAVYFIVTGLTAFDPIYQWLGYSTRTEHPDASDKIDYNNMGQEGSLESRPEYRQSA